MSRIERQQSVDLYQANALSRARYSFTSLEKNIMYIIIDEIQRGLKLGTLNRELFDNHLTLVFERERLMNISKNFKQVEDAFRSLRAKTIHISNGENNWKKSEFLIVGFINRAKKRKGAQTIEVTIDQEVLPAYYDLADKYTKYDAIIALNFVSVYSKRFYELGASWKHKGSFYLGVEQLREMFGLENKYKDYTPLRYKVIDTAMNEIKQAYDEGKRPSDFYITYTEKKEKSRRGRPKVIGWNFFIHQRKQGDYLTYEDKRYNTKTLLKQQFPTNPEFVKRVMKETKDEDTTNKLFKRIMDKYHAMKEGKIDSFPAVLFTMLKEDFKIGAE